MTEVTIPKQEYQELIDKAKRYDYLKQLVADDMFAAPPTRSRAKVQLGFASSGKYNQEFLASLHKGLKRSNYFTG